MLAATNQVDRTSPCPQIRIEDPLISKLGGRGAWEGHKLWRQKKNLGSDLSCLNDQL